MRGWVQHRPGRSAPWRARYYGLDGRERSKSFGRKVDAERWLTAQLAKLDRGEWVDPRLGAITWGDYSAHLQASRVHVAARTAETYASCHRRAVALIGDVPLSRITPELLRRLVTDLTEADYAPETVAKTMRWVRLTLNQAVKDRRIATTPAADIKLPAPRRSDMRLLDPHQVEHLASVLPHRYQALPVVAAYTGLRWGELAGLPVANIDMLRRRLTVRSNLIETAGQPPHLGPPKTTASERTITLPRLVIDALSVHLNEHPPVDGLVWTTQRGALLRRGSFGRIWRQAVTESVGPPCRLHDLRHTHAAWLIAAGDHPKTIQTRLGHSSIQVTMDRYGHLMEGLDTQTADRLDRLADSWSGPGAAQTTFDKTQTASENPVTRENSWQPRRDSNPRYRLERPAS